MAVPGRQRRCLLRRQIGSGWQVSGGLWFYAGNGAAGYAAGKQIGYGFPVGEPVF